MRPTFEVSNAGQRNGQTGESHSLEPIGRQTPDRVQTDVQALKIIDSRHEGLQAMPPGALDAVAARRAASSDEAVLNSFADKVLQGRAAAVMGDTADQHPTYKAALKEASPLYANLADRAYADDQQRLVAKEVRKALEFAGQPPVPI